jgi:hypothetical protein
MSQTVDREIDLTYITHNNSPPTLISITKARREISQQLQTRVCADPHTHDHGHSYIVWNNSNWLKKRQVTSPIIPPANPGVYGGNTHLLLYIYNLLFKSCRFAPQCLRKTKSQQSTCRLFYISLLFTLAHLQICPL